MVGISTLGLVATVAFLVLAAIGLVFYLAARGGWMRNGYFRIPAVVLIVLGLFIAFQAIGSGIVVATIGIQTTKHPITVLTINSVAEIVVMLLGTVVITRGVEQNPLAIFRLEGLRETPAGPYLLAIPIILAAQAVGEGISAIVQRFWTLFPPFYHVLNQYETAQDKMMQKLVTATGPWDFVMIFVFVAIVPALAEETLFRGFAQTNIERSGRWHARPLTALLVASLLFACVHGSLFKLPGLFVLALAIGWMTYRTNNLFVGGLGHAVNNGFVVAALYLSPSTTTNSSLIGTENMSVRMALGLLALSVPILVLLAYWFQQLTAPLVARTNAEREVQERLWNASTPAPHETNNEAYG